MLVLLKKIFNHRLDKLVKQSKIVLDDFLSPLLSQTRWFTLSAVGLLAGSLVLCLPEDVHFWFIRILRLVMALQVGLWGNAIISLYVQRGVDTKVQHDSS